MIRAMNGLSREWMHGPQWVQGAHVEPWMQDVKRAAAAWEELEILSVSAHVRPSALLYLTPKELVQATREAASQGLVVVPLSENGRAALTRPENTVAWLNAWTRQDDEAIGALLGFPECCTEHFMDTWAKGMIDTVRYMGNLRPTGPCTYVDGPAEANLLLRHIGVRLVPHLPCSPSCKLTVAMGVRMAEVARECGVDTGALYRLLNLPVTYQVLHGVATTSTPYFRFLSGTDYTATELVYKRLGTAPPEAAPARAPLPVKDEPQTWEDNGFSSKEAMVRAHGVVLSAVNYSWAPDSALDLGCGDGRLLWLLSDGRPGTWVGIDSNPDRLCRGAVRYDGVKLMNFRIEEYVPMAANANTYDLAFVMPGRLLEMDGDTRVKVQQGLKKMARRLVVYAYGDTLRTSLPELANRAGLALDGPVMRSTEAEAAIGSVM